MHLIVRFLVLSILIFAVHAEENDVIVGNKNNFKSIISTDGLALVKFFAPWCDHCKKIAGDFKEAATELKGKAILADLDATVEKELAEKYQAERLPAIKLFSKGELISEYQGSRTKEDIIKYVERALLASVTDCSDADAVSDFVKEKSGKTIIIGVALEKMVSEYMRVSMSLRDRLPNSVECAKVTNVDHVKGLTNKELSADSVLLIRDNLAAEVYSGKPEGLEAWAKVTVLPLFGEFDSDNADLYNDLNKPTFMLFLDPDERDADLENVVKELAQSYHASGALVFTWIKMHDLISLAEHIGVSEKTPSIAVYEFQSDLKYIFDEEYSPESLKKWLRLFVEGKLKPSIKSEEVPKKNDTPVKVVVRKSWTEIVEDEDKDVLVEQYAPWCVYCQELAPILDELAADLKTVETLVIAKMDASRNDAPDDYIADRYPTIHFFAAGSKKGVRYTGGRTKEEFVTYLQANCTYKEGIELPERAEKEEEEDKKEL